MKGGGCETTNSQRKMVKYDVDNGDVCTCRERMDDVGNRADEIEPDSTKKG